VVELLLLESDPELPELPEPPDLLELDDSDDELELDDSVDDEPPDSLLFAAAVDEPLLEVFDASRLSLR
jgi:hypothetical protein